MADFSLPWELLKQETVHATYDGPRFLMKNYFPKKIVVHAPKNLL